MKREVIPRTRFEKVKDKFHHWWKFLTNKKYRQFVLNPWRPQMSRIQPKTTPLEELHVQPMFKHVTSLPIMGFISAADQLLKKEDDAKEKLDHPDR